jgi:hypothetical protein
VCVVCECNIGVLCVVLWLCECAYMCFWYGVYCLAVGLMWSGDGGGYE